jgi:hypothetical protein
MMKGTIVVWILLVLLLLRIVGIELHRLLVLLVGVRRMDILQVLLLELELMLMLVLLISIGIWIRELRMR